MCGQIKVNSGRDSSIHRAGSQFVVDFVAVQFSKNPTRLPPQVTYYANVDDTGPTVLVDLIGAAAARCPAPEDAL